MNFCDIGTNKGNKYWRKLKSYSAIEAARYDKELKFPTIAGILEARLSMAIRFIEWQNKTIKKLERKIR